MPERQSARATTTRDSVETLDDILRYGAVALLSWGAFLIWRDFSDRLAGRLGALSALSSVAYLLGDKAQFQVWGIDGPLLVMPISSMSAIITWLFCLSLFDDGFRLRVPHMAVLAIKFGTGLAIYPSLALGADTLVSQLAIFSRLIILGVVIHLAIVIWQGRNDDLVEERRRFRSIFAVSVVVVSLAIILIETFVNGGVVSPLLMALQSFGFWAISIFVLWRLSSPNRVDLFFLEPQPANAIGTDQHHCELSPTDRHDLDTINAFTKTEGFLESGLTIAKLAQTIKVPEHRLRHLINLHLGYRNFADFLNHHRITVAQSRLSDIDRRNTSVLTIAMDLGYGSLGPFNRAFKARTGLTPTEFRMKSLRQMAAATK